MAVWGTPIAQEDDAERPSARHSTCSRPCRRSARRSGAAGASGARRRAHGRGRGHPRRRGPGHGRRRPRQHSIAHPGLQPSRERYSSARRRSGRRRLRSSSRTPERTRSRARPSRSSSGRRSRVISLRRRSGDVRRGLEPPFVGRDRELRLVKELYHATRRGAPIASRLGRRHRRHRKVAPLVGVREVHRRARGRRLVAVAGAVSPTATGSRSGRSQRWFAAAPGSSRTRRRALPARSSAPRSRSTSRIPRSARFAEPRLAHLLGLEEGAVGDQENLFAAGAHVLRAARGDWTRRCSSSRTSTGPTALCSISSSTSSSGRATHPLFVLTLCATGAAGPSARVGLGQAQLHVDLTSSRSRPTRWTVLLTGPRARASPRSFARRILERAEGVPFYAVETVRMLLDRGAARPRGQRLSARRARSRRWRCRRRCRRCIAARLDGLERRGASLVQHGGRARRRRSRCAGSRRLSGLSEQELEPLLATPHAQGDRRRSSPTRSPRSAGSTPSSRTSSRRSPTTRSQGASARRCTSRLPRISSSLGDEEEIVEVLAAHYLDAYRRSARRRRRREPPRDGTRDARPSRRASGVARAPTRRRSTRTSARSS